MRGLPFPSNAPPDRGPASEHGTPFSNVDDIPIDPALAGVPVIDPAIAGHGNAQPGASDQLHHIVVQDQFVPPRQRHYSQEPLQYHQGPQGDPFAPQPPAAYLPIPETDAPRATKPQKRKRRPRREEECSFCQGNDARNKLRQPEVMVSCEECGRSGHPSCMELEKVADVIRSYPGWKCMECKICEICQEKGADDRILFCDFCDRGWHMDCLQPRLEKEPPGDWYCPLCLSLGFPLPHLGSPLIQHDVRLPAGQDYSAGKSDPDGSTSDPAGAHPGVGVQVDNSSTDESSDSDSDSDETVNAPTERRPESVKKKKRSKRSSEIHTPRPAKRMRIKVRSPAPPLIVRLRLPPKGKGKEREDDTEHNIFEDLLPPGERDTSKTSIDTNDRTRFEKSRLAAEERLYPAPAPLPSTTENPDTPVAGPSSRPLRSTTLHQLSIPPALPPISPVPSTPSLVPPTPGTFSQTPNTPIVPDGQSTLRIRSIRFGPYDIHPWYDAPFPEEYANIPDGRLWICEFCLKYMRSRFAFSRHRMKCKARHPPGDEIYRDGSISIFEVDGRKNKIYCQNLCLLSKMFLDHKSLFYDVEPFLFYVMAEIDDIGAHFVGYFSKEKCSPKQYNVSCIMTLPVRQRQGWGNFLIDFSYLLSKKERRAGSPEKPLSGLGALGYKNYWTLAIMRYLRSAPPRPSLEDISRATSMTIEDIFTILVQQDMITVDTALSKSGRPTPGQAIKFPRGRRNGIARKHLQRPNSQKQIEGGGNKTNGSIAIPTHYEISWDRDKVQSWLTAWEKKGYLRLKPEKLKWTPFVLSRTKAGIEVLQSETGAGFAVVPQTETPRSPTDGETPMPEGGDRAKSLGSGQSLSNEKNEPVVRNTVAVTAANLFDDVLEEKAASPNVRAMSTRSMSAQAIEDEDTGDVVQRIEDTVTVPSRRRRARAPRDKGFVEVENRPTSPAKSVSPRKRRKFSSPPAGEEPRSAVEQQGEDGHAAVNGEGHTNGVRRCSCDAGLVTEGERGPGNGVAPQECSDVKSEDLGTPLTGLTSRHSVPSDDTVFVADGVNGSKISPLPRGGAEEGGAMEDSDLDAEGEPDDDI